MSDGNRQISIDELVAALADLQVTVADEEAARDQYQGYSWGYHGACYIESRQKAADHFGKILNGYIDQRIEAATGARP